MISPSLILALSLVTITIYPQEHDKHGKAVEGECTAVYIAPNVALTAAHCIQSQEQAIRAVPYTGGEYSAAVIDFNTSLDLAVISIKAPPHAYVRLAKHGGERGQRVYLMTSGEYMPGTYAEGMIENIVFDKQFHNAFYLHSAFIFEGASGSGLFNGEGELIGINTIKWGSATESVTLETVQYFLYCVTLRHPDAAILKTRENLPTLYEAVKAPFLLEFQLPQALVRVLLPR